MSENGRRLDELMERFAPMKEDLVDLALAVDSNILIYVDCGFQSECVLRFGEEDEGLQERLADAARYIRRGPSRRIRRNRGRRG